MYWGLAKCEKCQWHFARELFRFVACLQVLKFCGQAELAKAHGSGPCIRGENCQWQFAREPTLANWFCKDVATGSPQVSRIPQILTIQTQHRL